MDLIIRPLTPDLTEAYLYFFDNRAFSETDTNGPCYCTCPMQTSDEIDQMMSEIAGDVKGTIRRHAVKMLGEDALSGKMQQIKVNPHVAVCGEWFTGHGIGENLGHIRAGQNADLAAKLRAVFAAWYDNGHTDESDPNTVILRIRLTEGVLFSHGKRYDLHFANP